MINVQAPTQQDAKNKEYQDVANEGWMGAENVKIFLLEPLASEKEGCLKVYSQVSFYFSALDIKWLMGAMFQVGLTNHRIEMSQPLIS
jgi:hypothetical protein